MTIRNQDLKLYKPQTEGDFDESGGRMSSHEIVGGESNGLFPDVSQLDITGGRTHISKAFVAVPSDNDDTVLGANVILRKTPDNERVRVSMFSTGSHTDTRKDAREFAESYLIGTVSANFRLLEKQVKGQRSIRAYQKPNDTSPEAGSSFMLVTERGAHTGESQFVRVIDVLESEREITEVSGTNTATFKIKQLDLKLSAPLNTTFWGHSPSQVSANQPETVVKETDVADAAVFYGASKLTEPAQAGDRSVKVQSIFEHIAPSATSETMLLDKSATPNAQRLIASGGTQTFNYSGKQFYLPRACVPASFQAKRGDVVVFSDNGLGELIDSAGDGVGVIDCVTGFVSLNTAQSLTYTYTPATPVSLGQISDREIVTQDNRGAVWTKSLDPVPAPATLIISFMSQGRWYNLKDNGKGELLANRQGIGTGSLDYQTGTVGITLGALPDVGTPIIYRWGTALDFSTRASLGALDFALRGKLTEPANLADVIVKWMDNGAQKTASCNRHGVLSGDAGGRFEADGSYIIVPRVLPASGTVFTITRKTAQVYRESPSATQNANKVRFTLSNLPVQPGVNLRVPVVGKTKSGYGTTLYFKDDGNGALTERNGGSGTINYTTGECVLSLPTAEISLIGR